jgi:hypothetical protein
MAEDGKNIPLECTNEDYNKIVRNLGFFGATGMFKLPLTYIICIFTHLKINKTNILT